MYDRISLILTAVAAVVFFLFFYIYTYADVWVKKSSNRILVQVWWMVMRRRSAPVNFIALAWNTGSRQLLYRSCCCCNNSRRRRTITGNFSDRNLYLCCHFFSLLISIQAPIGLNFFLLVNSWVERRFLKLGHWLLSWVLLRGFVKFWDSDCEPRKIAAGKGFDSRKYCLRQINISRIFNDWKDFLWFVFHWDFTKKYWDFQHCKILIARFQGIQTTYYKSGRI